MKSTTNYGLNKPELTDLPDITVLNPNFDEIDEQLKNLNDKTVTQDTEIANVKTQYLPLSGGTITGKIYTKVADLLNRDVDDSALTFNGGSKWGNGASIMLSGKEHADGAGRCLIASTDGTNRKDLILKPDGTFTWSGKDVLTTANGLPLSGGTMTGTIKQTTQFVLSKTTDSSRLEILGGTSTSDGASLYLDGVNRFNEPGAFSLTARDKNGNSTQLLGEPDGVLTWGDNDVITSAGGMMTGSIKFPVGNIGFNNNDSLKELVLFADSNNERVYGAFLSLHRSDCPDAGGAFGLFTRNADNSFGPSLFAKPDGTLTWGSKNIVRSINGTNADASGNVPLSFPSNWTVSKGNNGWARDPNTGFTVVWGRGSTITINRYNSWALPDAHSQTCTFPKTFSTVLGVVPWNIANRNGQNRYNFSAMVDSLSTQSVTFFYSAGANDGALTFQGCYLAWGFS